MIDNSRKINYEEEVYLALNEYARMFSDLQEVPFRIMIVPNILETLIELSNDEHERDDWRANSETISRDHGIVYFPASIDNEFILIIHAARFNIYQLHYQTIAHEYTHILDFFEYSRALGVHNLQRKESIPDFECIHFYTEVRARYRSTLIYYNVVSLDKSEAPVALKSLANDYGNELCGDFRQDYYLLAQFYGQYLALVKYSCLEIQKPDWLINDYNGKTWEFFDINIDSVNIFPMFDSFKELFYNN